jgi:hypothetical protein
MKRIAFLVCGMLLLISNTAEARRSRWNTGASYTQPVQVVRATTSTPADTSGQAASETSSTEAPSVQLTSASVSLPVTSVTTPTPAKLVSYSTATAQGVANLMAANNRVGHWGGNPGYEGCGCGVSQAAAYNVCCYGNSGMATVDVGYAQGANGMWYCCRRYR